MPDITQNELRALTDAGLVPLHRYLAICAERGWFADPRLKDAA